MTNPALARDYLVRAEKRLKAIDVLHAEEAFADVVRESQEVVELALKAVLRSLGVSPTFVHDVSEILERSRDRFPEGARAHVPRWCEISKHLRRDRELSFYGSEDVTPSDFYDRADADLARAMAREVVESAAPWVR
ncbi:HEPN domain-containing protein [bacterium]|nr:HEPN domain-containing protein [bacterium]